MDAAEATTRDPLSRAERQQRTRDALLDAARVVFGRDGYHGANLATIAREAGYSKGAVYSNFASKAELFLAVMDRDLEVVRADDGGWDPLQVDERHGDDHHGLTPEMRGFALATLEFVAAAVRDERLGEQLAQRIQVLIGAYRRVARTKRPPDEQLPADDVAVLLAALDQGLGLLMISGVVRVDTDLMSAGLRRLLDPGAAGRQRSDPPTDS